jgi:hypothetical protein
VSDKLERAVPAVLVVALLFAAGGLVVQLRHVGDASGSRRPLAQMTGDSIAPASFGPSPSPASPASPSATPEPEPEERLVALPVEACAFNPVARPGALDASDTSVRGQIDAIAARVEELRELEFRKEVKPAFQDGERMAEQLERRITRSYTRETADRDERILEALGAIPRGTDLREVVAAGLGGDVLGYYVPKTGRLLVQKLDGDEGLGAGEKFVLAHELEHALADQRLGIPRAEDAAPAQADREGARQALTEGDASITMLQFATTSLTDEERLSLATDPSLGGESSLENAPYFVRKTFEFPYDRGADFVCALYDRGGWDAVNRAYDDPPESSAQVLFPQDYLDGVKPKNPRDARPPVGGWARHPIQSLGAADLLWLLEAPGGKPVRSLDDPERRVMSWLGGEVHLFTRGPQSAIAMDLVAKGRSGLLCESVDAWYRVSFPIDRVFKKRGPERFAIASKRQAAVLRCRGGEVRLGIGPTVPIARAVAR